MPPAEHRFHETRRRAVIQNPAPVAARLLEISSAALSASTPHALPRLEGAEPLLDELYDLLLRRNGFLAFESALHVYPSDPACPDDIGRWNSADLWRGCYADLAAGAVFFAQDVFGEQFAITPEGVMRFDPETGDRRWMASTIAEWAKGILENHRQQTGWPAAHDWQTANGVLYRGRRLVPRKPFVLQGEYEIDNLVAADAVL